MTRPSTETQGLLTHVGLLILLLLAFAPAATAQVVIKGRLEIEPTTTDKVQSDTGAPAFKQAADAIFRASSNGRLNVYYVSAERYGEALESTASLQVSMERKTETETFEDAVVPRFEEPQQLPSGACTEDWYFYGRGPFTWCAPNRPEAVNDAWVFSLSCDADWAQQHINRCTTTNLGGHPELPASAWTYWSDPAVGRSFLQFDLSGFTASVQAQEATLHLFPHGESQSQLSGSNAFVVRPVAQAWSEGAVTWANQPGTTDPSVTAPGGTGSYSLDVTDIVEG